MSNETPIAATSSAAPAPAAGTVDLNWVWREVRKRVFIKLPFSLGVADAMEAVVPITLTEDSFVCGLPQRDFALSGHLHATQVRNTIENILRQAAQRPIRFELIEGTTLADWQALQERQQLAHAAVVAIATQKMEEHHYDDVLNQIVTEMRRRITSTPDRALAPVRAHLMLELVPQLADVEEMLFAEKETHDRRRAMTRAIDRIASFLEVPPFTLALEIERLRMFDVKSKCAAPNRAVAAESLAPEPSTPEPSAPPASTFGEPTPVAPVES